MFTATGRLKGAFAAGKAALIIIVAGIVAASLNNLSTTVTKEILHLNLFMDTIFTMAAFFSLGVWAGVSASVFTTLSFYIIGQETMPLQAIYVVCSFLQVFVTAAFCRRTGLAARGGERNNALNTIVLLLILSALLCVVLSVSGGLVTNLIHLIRPGESYPVQPDSHFTLGLALSGLPMYLATLVARFPINIVDRAIASFGGYALACLVYKLQRLRRPRTPSFS